MKMVEAERNYQFRRSNGRLEVESFMPNQSSTT